MKPLADLVSTLSPTTRSSGSPVTRAAVRSIEHRIASRRRNHATFGHRYGGQLANEMKFRDLIKQLEADGWYLVRTRGSHRIYKHPRKPGTVTVVGKPSEEVKPKTMSSIRRQASI